jgi:hypothetical protein
MACPEGKRARSESALGGEGVPRAKRSRRGESSVELYAPTLPTRTILDELPEEILLSVLALLQIKHVICVAGVCKVRAIAPRAWTGGMERRVFVGLPSLGIPERGVETFRLECLWKGACMGDRARPPPPRGRMA